MPHGSRRSTHPACTTGGLCVWWASELGSMPTRARTLKYGERNEGGALSTSAGENKKVRRTSWAGVGVVGGCMRSSWG
jgi:hypothetical protein